MCFYDVLSRLSEYYHLPKTHDFLLDSNTWNNAFRWTMFLFFQTTFNSHFMHLQWKVLKYFYSRNILVRSDHNLNTWYIILYSGKLIYSPLVIVEETEAQRWAVIGTNVMGSIEIGQLVNFSFCWVSGPHRGEVVDGRELLIEWGLAI